MTAVGGVVSYDAGRLVGRDREIEAIGSFIETSRQRPASVLLEGDAGAGKTTIWLEGCRLAASLGHRVLRCRPVAAETQLSFAGLGDLLAHVFDDVAVGLPEAQQIALDGALLRSTDVIDDARAVAVAFAGLLAILAADAPVIVAIDDVQWLDAATRRVVQFAVRRVEDANIGFLVARRIELGERHDGDVLGLRRALGDDACERLRLGPLAPEALVSLVRRRLDRELPRTTLLQVARASGGNPLYALEIARSLPPGPMRPGEPLPVPDSLREGIRRNLGRVPADTRAALTVVAALARPLTAEVARALAPVPLTVLDAAVEAGLLEQEGEELRFTHPLLSSIALTDAGPGRRREVHRRLGEVVPDPEGRARHLALAAAGEDPAAASALEEAAAFARARGAPEAAAELFVLAAGLVPSGDDQARRLKVAAARNLLDAGDMRAARMLLEPLVAELPAGPPRAEVLGLLAQARFHSDTARVSVVLARQGLLEAEGHPPLVMELGIALTLALAITGDHVGAVAQAEIVRHLAAELGVPQGAEAADAIERIMVDPFGIAARSRGESTEVRVDDPEDLPLPGGRSTRGFVDATVLFWQGELDRARVILEASRAELHAAGDDGALPMVYHRLSRLDWWTGSWTSSREHAQAGIEIIDVTGRDSHRSAALSCIALIDACEGHVIRTREVVEEGLELSESTGAVWVVPELLWVRGLLELSLGRAAPALADLAAGREAQHAMAPHHPMRLWLLADEIEARLACGDVDGAEQCLELFDAAGVAAEVLADTSWVQAARARSNGLLLAARGDVTGALPMLAEALEIQSEPARPFDRARTLLVEGRVRRRAKQWGSARLSLTEALGCFEALGAPRWAERARAELARIGGRPPSSSELSSTERRVAELVATGRTNREVADELFIAVKTVEWHLGRIYRKLGVRNRAELGANLGASRPAP